MVFNSAATLHQRRASTTVLDPHFAHAAASASVAASNLVNCIDKTVGDAVTAGKRAARRLLKFEELPREWQENQYVRRGYRHFSTMRECFQSIFMVHNETCNIWTHLLGFFFFLGLAIYAIPHHLTGSLLADRLVVSFFFVAALKCLLCSTLYHTLMCHSKPAVAKCAATFDYVGIGLLITASLLTKIYYGFYCEDSTRNFYMGLTAILGMSTLVFPFFKFFDTHKYRPFRIFLFISLAGLGGLVPLAHMASIRGWAPTFQFLAPLLWSVIAYIVGVIFYGHRFPEKFWPGLFDYPGLTSHAIWHVFVMLGIFYHYLATLHFHRLRFDYGCAASI
ncbi:uncharacterized protein VTP21DRAFT_322 [Calcarisporiella thermophila]|uniref:uncharacterized protein n=1 Tax=Calcarisporiella thermophila TaxID=911321 RepID=UPI0037446460